MAHIHQFARYHNHENFATNNTLLLLGRIYQHDRSLFELFLNKLQDGGQINVGPQFFQQKNAGGVGIPDAVIEQPSFKIVVETKVFDQNFWGKEEYTSHFNKEATRILLTLSRDGMHPNRKINVQKSLAEYDKQTNSPGTTQLVDVTFIDLIKTLHQMIEISRSRAQLELEEIVDDYEDFALGHGLITDTQFRMHVFAINSSEEDNTTYTLYYNQANRRERPHRFIGLYRNKHIKYIAEVKTVVIPVRQANGETSYTILKGQEHFNDEMKVRINRFFDEEGWGFEGNLKFHMFDSLHKTEFRKTSYGGIMGPRHFDLRDYLEKFPDNFNDVWLAEQLNGKEWE